MRKCRFCEGPLEDTAVVCPHCGRDLFPGRKPVDGSSGVVPGLAHAPIKTITVTTGDLKRDYEVIGPVYFQVSNKGIFSSALSKLVSNYSAEIATAKKLGLVGAARVDWGFLYGEYSVGQTDFEKAFFVAVQELKKRASLLGADAVIGMRQDIDLDTTSFQFFYLQMYGTAIRFI